VEGGSTECADPGRVLREEAAPASAAVRFFLARPLGPASPAVHALVIMQRILLSVRPCAVQASRILLSVRPCAVQASRGDARAAGCRPCGALCARAGGRCCGDRGGAERGARPAASPPSSPPSRTKWTRLVHPSVLIGHLPPFPSPPRAHPPGPALGAVVWRCLFPAPFDRSALRPPRRGRRASPTRTCPTRSARRCT